MIQHIYRILILMLGSTVWLGWVIKHSEPDSNVGLRYIRQAEQIDSGLWNDGLVGGIDHPLHPLGIAAVHRLLGGAGPTSWQRAALVLCFVSVVLLVVPVYLLALELFGDRTAWLASLLVFLNPIVSSIVVNVLSESTFLLFWTFGLWGAVRFLRAGRFLWLPLAIGFGALAYLTRPEGLLLLVALTAVWLLLPLLPATRINWPRWWGAIAFVLAGLIFLVGPYIALKGGVGTKPGIARVLGLAPRSQPLALERESPLPPGQTTFETYRIATTRMLGALQSAVTLPLFPFSLLGLVLARSLSARLRAWLFLGMVLTASAVAMVRLHATGGYCTARHALVPGMILTLAAAYAFDWLMGKVAIPGWWLGLANERIRPGPAIWAALISFLIMVPNVRSLGPICPGPFWVYIATGDWLAQNTREPERVLDLTDWSLYFSQRPGYNVANVRDAMSDPNTRWIVVRSPHIEGNWHYDQIISELIGGREPVASLPIQIGPEQAPVSIYDRSTPAVPTSTANNQGNVEIWRQ
jgi:Dolichyl-phosphate-mannose-protein mannosyltransferase